MVFQTWDVPDSGCAVLVELVLCLRGGGQRCGIYTDKGDRAIGGVDAES